jgi:RNA polymerase sigma-70 factor (ECF subfamily)
MFANPVALLHPALVNGLAGVVVTVAGRPTAIMGFTVAGGQIIEIDALADPGRVASITSSIFP